MYCQAPLRALGVVLLALSVSEVASEFVGAVVTNKRPGRPRFQDRTTIKPVMWFIAFVLYGDLALRTSHTLFPLHTLFLLLLLCFSSFLRIGDNFFHDVHFFFAEIVLGEVF